MPFFSYWRHRRRRLIITAILTIAGWLAHQHGWAQSAVAQEMFAAGTDLPADLAERFRTGRLHYERGEIASAAAIFRQLVKKQPAHLESRLYLALSYNRLGEYSKSATLFAQLRQVGYLRPKHFLEAGYAMLQIGEFASATDLLKQFPRQQPQYDMAMYYAGVSEVERGNYKSATTYLKRAVVLPTALAESKNALLKQIAAATTAKSSPTPATQAARSAQPPQSRPIPPPPPQHHPAAPDLMPPLRQPQQRLYLHAWNDLYVPVYEPPKEILFNFSLVEPGYVAEWRLAHLNESAGLFGLGVHLGSRYSLEYFVNDQARAVERTTPYLDDHFSATVIGKAGERHDNLSFFMGINPFLEWQSQRLTVGMDALGRGFYGTFNESLFVSHLRASPYLYYLISARTMAALRLQAEHWYGVTYTQTSAVSPPVSFQPENIAKTMVFYGASGHVRTQFHQQFSFKMATAFKRLVSTQKSAIAQHTLVGAMELHYAITAGLNIQVGTLITRHHEYQIWPTQQAAPYKSHGHDLGLMGGIIFTPFDQIAITINTVSSKLLWSPLGTLEDVQWHHYAPTAQTHLHLKLQWSHKI